MGKTIYNLLQDAFISYQFWESASFPTMGMGYDIIPTGITPATVYVQVGGQIVESSSLTKMIRVSQTSGTVKARRFYETGTILPPPPPSGTGFNSASTYDPISTSMAWYPSGALVDTLNSGSNEWSNVTTACMYVARECWTGKQEWDAFYLWGINYSSGSLLHGLMTGSLTWAYSNPYNAHFNFAGVKVQDDPYRSTYSLNTLVNGLDAVGFQTVGTESTAKWGGCWSGSWIGSITLFGLKAYDDPFLASYALDTYVDGLMGSPEPRYQAFMSASWIGKTNFFGVKAYDEIYTGGYLIGYEINGTGSSPIIPYYLAFGSSSWIGKTL